MVNWHQLSFPSWEETIYICAIKDFYVKSIIAYLLSQRNVNKLVLDSLSKGFENVQMNQRQNLILHSDQGYQLTSNLYKERLNPNNVIHRVSYRGSCVDNVPIEFWFSTLKTESVYLLKHLSEEKMIQVVSDYVIYTMKKDFYSNLKI